MYIFLGLLGLSIVAAFYYLYWDFLRTPQRKWSTEVLRLWQKLALRLKDERRKYDTLDSQEKRELAGLRDKHLCDAISQISVEELRGYPGIGPGTVSSLFAAGLSTVERVRVSPLNISGFGDKRIGDVRSAVAQVVADHEHALADLQTALGSSLEAARDSVQERFRVSRQQIKSNIEQAEAVRDDLLKLKKVADPVTFGKYLAKSLPELVPAPYLQARLPDINALFKGSEDMRGVAKTPEWTWDTFSCCFPLV